MATAQGKLDQFIDRQYLTMDPKVRILTAVLLLALPVVLYYFLFLKGVRDDIARLERQRRDLQSELRIAKAKAGRRKQVERELQAAEARFSRLLVLLPKTKEIPELLRSISDLGKGAGLEFVSFKPGGESPKEFYAEFPLDITLSGPYHNVGRFLWEVSRLDRIVTVNNIKMGGAKVEEGETVLKASCRLLTYRFTGVPSPEELAEKEKKAKKKGKKGKRP